VQSHEGLKQEHPFLEARLHSLVLTMLQIADDEVALTLRFYEWAGKESDIKLQPEAGANSAAKNDLMEKPVPDLSFQEGAVTAHTKPFEIKTVRIRFGSKLPAAPAERSSN